MTTPTKGASLCSKCNQPLSGTIQGRETATWHAVCPSKDVDQDSVQ